MRENYLSFHLREEHESRYCPLWCIWILFLFLLLLLWTIISPFFKFLLGRWLGSRRVFLSLLFSRLLKMVHKVSECKCIFNSRETKKKKKKKCWPLFHLHYHYRQSDPHLNHQLENPHHPCQQQNLNPILTLPYYMELDKNIKRQI